MSLLKIIDTVLEEAPNTSVDDLEKDKRNLYRKFERLIEKLGADKEAVKKVAGITNLMKQMSHL